MFLFVAALLTDDHVSVVGSWEEVWLSRFSLWLPTQQPAQLSKALTLPGCGQKVMIWLILRSEQGGAKEQDSTALWQFFAFPERGSGAKFLPLGCQVCFGVGVLSFDALSALLAVASVLCSCLL